MDDTKSYYVVVNGENLKYCLYMGKLGDNDDVLNPYNESTYVGHAYFCTSVEEARQRIEERYKGIVDDPRIVRIVLAPAVRVDGRYKLSEWELLGE